MPEKSQQPRHRLDRWLLLAMVVAACVVMPRAVLITRAHSETWDEQYHLLRGLIYLERIDAWVIHNDPPLGGGIVAVPLWLTGVRMDTLWETQEQHPDHGPSPLYDHHYSPQTLRLFIALWKSLLFIPFVGLVFHWCRQLYGLGGAWLATALLLTEPNFAAHLHLATLDVLGVQAIVLACYLGWRCVQSATRGRIIAAAVAVAAGMLIKHTALILPGVMLAYALAGAIRKGRYPTSDGATERAEEKPAAPSRTQASSLKRFGASPVVLFMLVMLGAIWALTLFNISMPRQWGRVLPDEGTLGALAVVVNPLMDRPMPAGNYLGSLAEGVRHAGEGHSAYLLGEHGSLGWWYYFPVVASYKVPLGIALVLLLAGLSFYRVRPRWEEAPLLIAAAAWALTIITANINIGFRHALPAYIFMLMLAGRCALPAGRWLLAAAWAGVVLAAVHVASWHPNYLSYINFPRENAYRDISDSNIDWGQALPQVRRWLDEHPRPGRPIYIGYFGDPRRRAVPHYLGEGVIQLYEGELPPSEGLLILSPVWEVGLYAGHWWQRFQDVEPVAIIGDSIRIYDLDATPPAGAGP